jgi:hypothetical protein
MNFFDILSDWLEEEGFEEEGFQLIVGPPSLGSKEKTQILVHRCTHPSQWGMFLEEGRAGVALAWNYEITRETPDDFEITPRKILPLSDPKFFSKLKRRLNTHKCKS